jgi:hypothetical protein
MVTNEVCHTQATIASIIVLFTNKTFLSYHLFNENGEGLVDFFKGEKLTL